MKSLLSSLVLTLICVFSYSQTPSILLFKDTNAMTMILNPNRFKQEEVPIMSFQTNKNGTFNPIITPSSGTLKWVVDGVEQITNTPSFPLTGSVVDVEIYANDVVEGEEVTAMFWDSLNIIGQMHFSWFRLNCSFAVRNNIGLTMVSFSSYANVIHTLFRVNSCSIAGAVDCTNIQFVGSSIELHTNPITDLIFSSSANTLTAIDISYTNIVDWDLSNTTSISGDIDTRQASELEVLNLGTNPHVFSGRNEINGTKITSLDFSDSTIANQMRFGGNSLLSSITYNTIAQSLVVAQAHNNDLDALDWSMFTINGEMQFYGNIGMTTFTQPLAGSSTALLRGYNCNLTGNVALNNITVTGVVDLDDNSLLTSITEPIYTTDFSFYDFSGCGLVQNDVDPLKSGIDEIIANLKTFFSSNTPTGNFTLNISGGTNASPGAQGLLDIADLETIFTTAGFTFTSAVN